MLEALLRELSALKKAPDYLSKQGLREQVEALLSTMPDDAEMQSVMIACNVPGEQLSDGRKITAHCFLHGPRSDIYTTCYQIASEVWQPGMEPASTLGEVEPLEVR